MDIYSFINSPDISAHCREIKKVWTPFEMAVIIGISRRPAADKLIAWRGLITDYPDMPTPEGSRHKSYPSLHRKLEEAIAYEEIYTERAFAILKQQEPGAVYSCEVDGGIRAPMFTAFDLAFSNMRDDFDRKDVHTVKVKKFHLDDADNDKGQIEACLDYDGNLMAIDVCAHEELRGKWFPGVTNDAGLMFSDDFYVIIPTPFKRGDILTLKNSADQDGLVFVLEAVDFDDPQTNKRRLCYCGDITDMTASGYCMDEGGILTQKLIIPYSDCEYYRGKLEGPNRLLQYVSWYLRKEIPLPALMVMQGRIAQALRRYRVES